MFDDWGWKSYKKVMKEAREPTHSRVQHRKDISAYVERMTSTPPRGHRKPNTGSPFTGKMKRFGTDRLHLKTSRDYR